MKNLFCKGLCVLFLVTSVFKVSAQSLEELNGKTIDLPQPTLYKNYVARDKVHVKPGAHISTSGYESPYVRLKIDEAQVHPVGGDGETTDGYNPIFSTNYSVGKSTYNVAPSGTGSATVNFPIKMAPGVNGMVPSIVIGYNSQGGNGVVGYGWNIGGLSAISRTSKPYYREGEFVEVKFDDDEDDFSLDGNRLFESEAISNEYLMENDVNAETNMYYSNSENSYFEVKTVNGMLSEYGNTADSKFSATTDIRFNNVPAPNRSLVWRVNKMVDAYGNYITYTYLTRAREHLIQKIEYGGNEKENTPHINTVEFFYSERKDVNTSYSLGVTMDMMHLLRKIKVSSNKCKLYEYEFVYEESDYSLLRELVEKNGEDERFNSTYFDYEGLSVESKIAIETVNIGNGVLPYRNTLEIAYDYDNDGLDDIARLHINNDGEYGVLRFYHNEGDLNFTHDENDDIELPTYSNANDHWLSLIGSENRRDIKGTNVGDFDGDGFLDLIFFNVVVANNEKELSGFDILYGNKEHGPEQKTFNVLGNRTNIYDVLGSEFYAVGDFDGDGKSEIFLALKDFEIIKPNREGTTNSDYTRTNVDNINRNPNGVYSVNAINFDGDGAQEIMLVLEGHTLVGSIPRRRNSYKREFILKYNGGFPTSYHDFYLGDFNGDGLTDILSTGNGGHEWEVTYSTGGSGGFVLNGSFVFLGGYFLTGIGNVLRVADINGDGKSDLVTNRYIKPTRISPWDKSYYKARVYISFGMGFTSDKTYFHSPQHENLNNSLFTYGDFLGMGFNQHFFRGAFRSNGGVFTVNDPVNYNLAYFESQVGNQIFPGVKLTEVVDGSSLKTRINYGNLTLSPNYTLTDIVNNNNNVIKLNSPGFYFAESIETENVDNTVSTTKYSYKDGLVYLKGRGFLGFLETGVVNDVSKTKQVSINDLKVIEDFVTLQPFTVDNYADQPNVGYRLTTQVHYSGFDLIKRHGSQKSFQYKPTSTSTSDVINGVTTFNLIDYDDQTGYPLSTKTLNLEANTSSEQIFTDYRSFNLGTQFSKYALVPHESASKSSSSINAYETNKILSINKDNGQVDNIKSYKDAAMTESEAVYVEYKYDGFGNVESEVEKTQTQSETWRGSYFTYDESGRFLIGTSNSLGHGARMKYDERFGSVVEKTNANGLTNTSKYDAWGRLVQECDAYNVCSTIDYTWNNAFNPEESSSVRNFTTVTDNYGVESKVGFDKWGRKVLSSGELFGDLAVNSQVFYNEKGQVEKSVGMHSSLANAVENTTLYDYLGRPETSSVVGLRTINTLYNGLETEVTTPVESKKTMLDEAGRMLKTTDGAYHKGVDYEDYDGYGQPKKIVAPGKTIEIEYDAFGRQEILNDPDAGITKYEYNYRNELTKQIDAKGNETFDLVYDQLGRLLSKKLKDGTTGTVEEYSYTYDTQENGKGKLTSVEGPNNHSTDFVYDDHSRVEREREVINGKSYVTEYAYNDKGQLESRSYPSGFALEYEYDDKGYLTKMYRQSDGKLLWELKAVDDKGRITERLAGNGKTTIKTYDKFGFLEGINTTGVSEWGYTWNKDKGQLRSRTNLRHNQSESFAYSVDRLSKILDAQGNEKSYIDYDNNSRIKGKNDVGDYQYDASTGRFPNAVKKIVPISGANPMGRTPQEISYTAFNSINTISENGLTLDVEYGHHEQRIHSKLLNGTVVLLDKTFVGDYEVHKSASVDLEIHYVSCPDGLLGVYVIRNGVGSMYYTYSDYLGSIQEVTNEAGEVVYEQNFDAWGRRRNPQTWEYINTASSITTTEGSFNFLRGYTLHEELPEFGLVNMNGRVYDPVLGMMISPDNYVQDASNSGNFNRYAYVLNNPLKYTDPSGEFIVESMIIGAFINLAFQDISGNISSTGDYFMAIGIGAASGAAGAWVGGATAGAIGNIGFASGAVVGGTGGFAGGFVGGAGNAWMAGANLNQTIGAGLNSGAYGAVFGAISGGIGGGIRAKRIGHNFVTGTGTSMSKLSVDDHKINPSGKPSKIKTDKQANKYLEENFNGAKKYVKAVTLRDNQHFRNAGFSLKDGVFQNAEGEQLLGLTIFDKATTFTPGSSIIGISQLGNSTMGNFHAVLGHEVIHAFHYVSGFMSMYGKDASEYYAHKWSTMIPHDYAKGSILTRNHFFRVASSPMSLRLPLHENQMIYPTWVH
jgi:RHS repeat-associated protein